MMTPLYVSAHLKEGIVLIRPLMLDALLTWSVASRKQLLPPIPGETPELIDIPVERSACGRYWLCSQGFCRAEERELRYKNRRAPWVEYARLGNGKKQSVKLSLGADKSYRVPYELQLLEGDKIEWWCVGDADVIRDLLRDIHYLGKHRNTGKGALDIHGTPWKVEECEPWEGFPVLRDGLPLRQLPLDAPGLADNPPLAYRVLDPPYYDQTREEVCACPSLS